MLVEVGSVADAQEVFEELDCPNEWSLNHLMNGYIRCGKPGRALDLYHTMQMDRRIVHRSAYTVVAALKACTSLKDLIEGLNLHLEASRLDLIAGNIFVGNALIDMYAKCGILNGAQEVFDGLVAPTVVSWTMLIAGYADNGEADKAIHCFCRMQCEAVAPDLVTLVSILKACPSSSSSKNIRCFHAIIDRPCLLEQNYIVGNTLIDIYIKCGLLAEAHKFFEQLPFRDTVSWTTLISGYVEHGYGEKALQQFEYMQLEGVEMDAATFVCTLKACGSIRAENKGRMLHAEAEKLGFLARSHTVGNTLVDMYSKCGLPAKAKQVFEALSYKDVVSWTALILAYAECADGEKALICFEKMKADGVFPNATTFICCMRACSSIGAVDRGESIHVEVERCGLLEKDVAVGTALVNMYVQCGMISKAQEVFDGLSIRDGITWTALLMGYAYAGRICCMFHVFDRMLQCGLRPNMVTFLVILTGFSRTSFSSYGEMYFEFMSKKYGIVPRLEHHTCLINVLFHSGELEKANSLVERMPFSPDFVVWHSVLSGCKNSGTSDDILKHYGVLSHLKV
ncbi:hypothetical protein KP509_16G047600 [Ceratopteris richardii]|uniref:Pentatricopeptide repeat-containing protein n=1 Tax=Ceratopteris richardii TaxID=49495 RepID=A0A8T2SZD0_CERRI|nr:hypothetical protein KP509_16G047600 [Ceratopteris richardii]